MLGNKIKLLGLLVVKTLGLVVGVKVLLACLYFWFDVIFGLNTGYSPALGNGLAHMDFIDRALYLAIVPLIETFVVISLPYLMFAKFSTRYFPLFSALLFSVIHFSGDAYSFLIMPASFVGGVFFAKSFLLLIEHKFHPFDGAIYIALLHSLFNVITLMF